MERDDLQTTVFMLVDWEKETWARVYCRVAKDATFRYTFDRKDVRENKVYPNTINNVHAALIKMPKNTSAAAEKSPPPLNRQSSIIMASH